MKEVKCDGCGAVLECNKHYFTVLVSNTIYEKMYDMCSACVRWQKIPILPEDMEKFSVQATKRSKE